MIVRGAKPVRGAVLLVTLLAASAQAEPLYTFNDLGTLSGDVASRAAAINNAGEVVGTSAAGINDAGQVVGVFNDGSHDWELGHAYLQSAGVFRDLGTLGGSLSAARAINASGQVVGTSGLAGDLTSHAFLYDNGTLHD